MMGTVILSMNYRHILNRPPHLLSCRHWQKLMELTGKNFDMNPETFTLENLFAMELHNYAETISDIVASANKELSIEKSLSEVVSTWQTLRFTVIKYVNTHTHTA